MDADGSGFLDFKEYKITRYLFDGNTDRHKLLEEFSMLTGGNSYKL